jgi:hypothetical protein
VRAAVARSPAWTRGGSLGHARRRARERKGEASTAASGGFLKQRRRGRGGGSGGGRRVESRNREERGGPGRGVGQRGDAASAGSGPAVVRVSGAVWHIARPAEQGRG